MFDDPEHVIPDNERHLHTTSLKCACAPTMESAYIPSVGGVTWYKHNEMRVPDEIPHWMYTDNDPED